MRNHTFTLVALVGLTLPFTAVHRVSGEAINDDFESYVPGTFPSPPWNDVGLIDPSLPNPPDPSATVEITTDAARNLTQALVVTEAIAPSQGIYQLVGESCFFVVAADVRVDRWADAPPDGNPAGDWAIAVGVVQVQFATDLACSPDTTVYASSITHGWRVFSVGTAGAFSDFSLNTPITLGRWYRVQMELETVSGDIGIKIWDLWSDTLLLDETTVLGGWTPEDGQFNAIAIFDGELSPEVTISNLAVVDNISVQVGLIGDINGDGVVNVLDLIDLLLCFGQPADPGCEAEDVNGDGNVNVLDLIELLLAFGTTCP